MPMRYSRLGGHDGRLPGGLRPAGGLAEQQQFATPMSSCACSATSSRRSAPTMSRRSPTSSWSENAINGMLTALDPHSSYMNAKSFDDMQVQTQRRVRRPRHRGHHGERPRQGGVADRRHPGRPRRHPARRFHHRSSTAQPVMGLLALARRSTRCAARSIPTIKLTIQRGDRGAVRRDADARRRSRSSRSAAALEGTTSPISASPASASRPTPACEAQFKKLKDQAGGKLRGHRARPAQQSGRPARPGGRRLRRLPRQGRDRLDPRRARRGRPALQRPRRATSPTACRWSC